MGRIVEEFVSTRETPWENLVEIGDICSRGLYPYLLPDEKTALLCYDAASKSPSPKTIGSANANKTELLRKPLGESDRSGDAIDVSYGKNIVSAAYKYMEKSTKKVIDLRPKKNKVRIVESTEIETRNSRKRRESNQVTRGTRVTDTGVTIPRARVAREEDRVGGGSQNTHDDGVTSATETNIRELKQEFELAG